MRASGEQQVTNVLGKYRLIAELGHGGMADVYLAVAHGPAGFNKLVVVKQIRPQFAEDPEFLAMFLDEARLAARLSHPNVVMTNEVGEDQGRYFMAMEYLEGQPLNRIIHRVAKVEGQLPIGMYVRILIDVLAGLHHAHELCDYDETPLEVVHRDVTPHNVFVTYDGMVKIVDFGIAKALSSSAETRAGVLKGKVAYMAPEQMRGERVDRRADLYSVGVMLWEAATGKRLWKGKPDVAILQEVMSGRVPPPSTVNPAVPARLEAICNKALAPNRKDRYATASELAADLEGLLEDRSERVTLRDVGKLVSGSFYQDRARMRSVVETQVKTAQQLVTDEWRSVSIPRIPDPPTTASNPMADGGRISGVPPASGSDPRRTTGSDPRRTTGSDPRRITGSNPQMITGSDPRMITGSNPRLVTGSDPRMIAASDGTPVTSPTRTSASLALSSQAASYYESGPRRLRLVAVAGVVALATAVVGAWLIVRRGDSPESAAPASVEAVPPQAPTAVPAPTASEVAVTISANPAGARLSLDGRPLGQNPFRGNLPRDTADHELRVEADGYAPLSKKVRLESDFNLTLTLAHEPSSDAPRPPVAGRRTAPPPPAQPPPPPDSMDGRPKPRPKRSLDADNPYAK